MIEVNSLKKAPDNLSSSTPALIKTETDESKEIKGTEIAGRGAVDIAEVPNNEVQNKRDLLAEVKENLEKLNEYIPVTSTNLVFEFDELGDPPVIKVLDKENDEVIREIPTKEFREVAKALDEFADKLTNKGLLFNSSV